MAVGPFGRTAETPLSIDDDVTVEDVTVELDVSELAVELRRWLAAGTQMPSGAIAAWLDHESGRPAFEYPEISGYALTHFAGSPAQGDRHMFEFATGLRTAAWLMNLIDDGRLAAREGWDDHAVYNFDLAMIANGLMVFGLRLEQDRLVEHGLSLVSCLTQQLERYGHLPSIDQGTSPVSQRSAWSTEGFAHLVKVAQCMLMAAELGLDSARDAASAVVSKGLAGQQPDGRIVTHPADDVTMLHPHLYAVEGLWVYGMATGNDEALSRARLAVEWVDRQKLPNGGLPRFATTSDGRRGPEQCDVTAQFLRAAKLTGFKGDVSSTARRLCSVSVPIAGLGRAMPYQPGTPTVHRNVWASMFAAQGCEVLSCTSSPSLNWRYLV